MRKKRNSHGSRRRRVVQRGNIHVTIYPNTGSRSGKNTGKKQRRRQTGRFLNRYDFAHAGKDTVNQLGKIAPDIINQVNGEINEIAQQKIDQVVRSGRAEIKQVAPKIIRGAIKEVYKTPFRLLGNLGKRQFQKIKNKLFK